MSNTRNVDDLPALVAGALDPDADMVIFRDGSVVAPNPALRRASMRAVVAANIGTPEVTALLDAADLAAAKTAVGAMLPDQLEPLEIVLPDVTELIPSVGSIGIKNGRLSLGDGLVEGGNIVADRQRIRGFFQTTEQVDTVTNKKLGDVPITSAEAAVGKQLLIYGRITNVTRTGLTILYLNFYHETASLPEGQGFLIDITSAATALNSFEFNFRLPILTGGYVTNQFGVGILTSKATTSDGAMTVLSLGQNSVTAVLTDLRIIPATPQIFNIGILAQPSGGNWGASFGYDINVEIITPNAGI